MQIQTQHRQPRQSEDDYVEDLGNVKGLLVSVVLSILIVS